jgi:hypothetical protein
MLRPARVLPRSLPGLVVGLVLGLLLAGGAAIGAAMVTGSDVKNGSLTGKDVKDRSLGSRDIDVYFAIVNSDGTLFRGSSGAKSRSTSQGVYKLTFGVDLTQCAVTATVGSNASAPISGGATKGYAEVEVVTTGQTQAVIVRTQQPGSPAVARPFHMIAAC